MKQGNWTTKNILRAAVITTLFCVVVFCGATSIFATETDSTEAILPAATPAETDATETISAGHKYFDLEVYQMPDAADKTKARRAKKGAAALPQRYDPRKKAWYPGNILVRNQGDSNLCWAFSVLSATEISYAKELNQSGASSQLSPAHLGYFLYNRQPDPMGGTNDDENIASVKGNWYDEGGFMAQTMLQLASWSGPAEEKLAPFSTANANKKYDTDLAYQDALHLENSIYYTELYHPEEPASDIATVKNLINTYGAVVVSMNAGSQYFQGESRRNAPYYCDAEYEPKSNVHEVVLVGWDDNYDAANFGPDTQPENPGAWIMLNSWGPYYGDQGYYYISYESKDVLRDGITAYDMSPAEELAVNYQYDGTAFPGKRTLSAGQSVANVFTAKYDTELTGISFTEYNNGTAHYRADLYTQPDPAAPDEGRLVATKEFTTETAGTKTIPLDEPIRLEWGETWSIVITPQEKGTVGSEHYDKDSEADYVWSFAEGQSFQWDADQSCWTDLAPQYACVRIKGIGRICPRETKAGDVCLSRTAFTYNGKVQRPQVTVKYEGETLPAASYEVTEPAGSRDAGTYTLQVKMREKAGYTGTITKTYTIAKAGNPLTLKTSKKTVKYKKLKKKARTVTPIKVKKKQGTLRYKGKGLNKKSRKALRINTKTGKITVKKNAKRGTYKMKVTVRAAGNKNYKAKTLSRTVTIRVK